jgi:hypothetical protein
MQQQPQTSPLSAPVHSREEAETLAQALEFTLKKIAAVLAQETELAKAGKLRDAINLQPEKARLTESFIKTAERFRANMKYFKAEFPDTVKIIHKLHEQFHAEVGRNMTALATAKALSESLISEVIEAVQEHERPSGYTTSGKMPADKPSNTPPLKLNISL